MDKSSINLKGKTDSQICLYVYTMIIEDEEVLRFIANQMFNVTDYWQDTLEDTLIGKICIEVVEREITEEYFTFVVSQMK